jgi:Flp pilus assembly protein TadD
MISVFSTPNLEQAEEMIRKAVAAEPENPHYLDSMGWVLYKRGKFEQAVEWLEKAAKLAAAEHTTWDHLGDAYHGLRQRDKSVEAWQKALELAELEPRPDTSYIRRIEAKFKDAAKPAPP